MLDMRDSGKLKATLAAYLPRKKSSSIQKGLNLQHEQWRIEVGIVTAGSVDRKVMAL